MNMLADMKPPYSEEAERNTLGSILIDPTLIEVAKSILAPDDFFLLRHQILYRYMLQLHATRTPVDMVTLSSEMPDNMLAQAGGLDYLLKITQLLGTSIHIEVYAHIVKRTSVRRKAINACFDIIQNAMDESKTIDQFESSSLNLLSDALNRTQERGRWLSEIISDVYDQVERAIIHKDLSSIPTGFRDVDTIHGGGLGASLTVLAGRPGMGKSSFMDSMLYNLIILMAEGKIEPFTIFYATTERTDEEVARRVLSIASEIADVKLRTGNLTQQEAERFTDKVGVLAESSVFIDDTPSITPAQLEMTASRLVRQHNCKLVLDDGAYRHMSGEPRLDNGDNQHAKFTRIYTDMKNASTRLRIPIITTHQLNRNVEARSDHRPRLSDLRESGTIEQEANNVWFLYRPDVYADGDTANPNEAELIVAKQRSGPTGTIPLYWQGEYTKYMNTTITRVDLSDLE